MKKQTCEYVKLSGLVHRTFGLGSAGAVFAAISEGAPFSWGDNDHTLVRASRLLEHCGRALFTSPETLSFMKSLKKLGDTYVDLES